MANATAVLERPTVRIPLDVLRLDLATTRTAPLVDPVAVGPCPGCPCSLNACASGGCGCGCQACCPSGYTNSTCPTCRGVKITVKTDGTTGPCGTCGGAGEVE